MQRDFFFNVIGAYQGLERKMHCRDPYPKILGQFSFPRAEGYLCVRTMKPIDLGISGLNKSYELNMMGQATG